MRNIKRKLEGDTELTLKLIDEICRVSLNGAVIIVEGKSDEEVLRAIGVQGVVMRYSELGKRKIADALGKMNFSKLLILTDFDEEGEGTAMEIERLAEENCFKVDRGLRSRFKKHLSGYSNTIEGLREIFNESLKRRLKKEEGRAYYT